MPIMMLNTTWSENLERRGEFWRWIDGIW